MKPIEGYDKLRGGYYTPKAIVEYITNWAIRSKTDTVLEPSCGDGVFIETACSKLRNIGCHENKIVEQVFGVEIDSTEAKKASIYPAKVINEDFFTFYRSNDVRYDVVVGNPPFIRYQNFSEEYRKIAFELMQGHGFRPNRLTNIWLPFLVLSCKALKDDGRIGMVIPAELFQVDYAAEARNFLSEFFDRLTIITFKELVLVDIQQEVVLLLGEKRSVEKGIRVIELQDVDGLNKKIFSAEVKELDHDREKWVKYYLSNEELSLLRKLNQDSRITSTTELFEANVGLVSGENDFFVINKEMVERFDLHGSVLPIVSKAEQVKGLFFNDDNFNEAVVKNRRSFLFSPEDKPYEELSKEERAYIDYGETMGFHKNYKCRTRRRWYIVPTSWGPDAFFIRQANMYPKIILNEAKTSVTDTLHKIRFYEGVSEKSVAAAFINSYTLALSETAGRSYGGGVLTFEPGEVRKLRIPMIGADKLDFSQMDAWQRNGQTDKLLSYTDDVLLRQGLNLSEYEIKTLRGIWCKLRDRRLNRKNGRNRTTDKCDFGSERSDENMVADEY